MLNEALEATSPNYRQKVEVKIFVTQSHIDCGRRSSCNQCPVALAIFELLGERWMVGPSRITHATTHYQIRTPSSVELFVFHFDNVVPVQPFDFTIEVPIALLPNDDSFLKVFSYVAPATHSQVA